MTLRVGTRGSALALAQTRALLTGLEAEVVPIVSEGDRTRASLASLGGTGVFVTALRDALLAGQVDAIVHSCKDLPTAPLPGVEVVAFPARADARDVLVTRGATLAQLPPGARVGTGSPRRRAQVLRARPDLSVVDLRGNLDTRLGRVLGGEADLDAVVLAAAGLHRLGRSEAITQYLPWFEWPPAPAQGALAVEVRAGAAVAVRAGAALDDCATRAAVTAEREVLALLEAGCAAPLGVAAGQGRIVAEAYSLDGARTVRAERPFVGDAGEAAAVVDDLLAGGAADLL